MGDIMNKKISLKTIVFLLLLITSIIAGGLWYKDMRETQSGNKTAKKSLKEMEALSKELEDSEEIKPSGTYSKEKIYDVMHRMANSKIIAKDNQIWGTLPMDSKQVATVKAIVEKVNYSDRDYILEVLERWENEDFSKADKEHNYFWKKLGGTIGEATGIKK